MVGPACSRTCHRHHCDNPQAKMEMAAAKRTNRDSLVEDVWAKNPKIKEEVRS